MINWSTDEKRFKKENPKEYKLWRLTQLINYGLDGEKIDKDKLVKAWPKIKDRLDYNSKIYLEYLIWGKIPSSHQFKEDFWTLS